MLHGSGASDDMTLTRLLITLKPGIGSSTSQSAAPHNGGTLWCVISGLAGAFHAFPKSRKTMTELFLTIFLF